MNLSERGAQIAAPIIVGNEELRILHNQLMTEGNKQEATHMIAVITAAELLAREPVSAEQPAQLAQQATIYKAA